MCVRYVHVSGGQQRSGLPVEGLQAVMTQHEFREWKSGPCKNNTCSTYHWAISPESTWRTLKTKIKAKNPTEKW